MILIKQWKILAIGILIALLVILAGINRSLRVEKTRLTQNQTTLLSKAAYFENKYGESQSSVNRLLLTVDEAKECRDDIAAEASRLNIKLRRMQSLSKTATETKIAIETVFKDSLIIIKDTIKDTVRCVEYADEWIQFSGCEGKNGVFTADFISVDTVVQVVHRVPKKWLFFKWGCKAIKQEIISKNPHTKIIYNEYIELKK